MVNLNYILLPAQDELQPNAIDELAQLGQVISLLIILPKKKKTKTQKHKVDL